MSKSNLNKSGLNALERRSVSALASVYGLRMFGLFLILPVLAIYAEDLPDATPMLMGLALGVYGVTQALFQIPFGILSDRFGRKPMIILGLSIFIVGSLVAAFSSSISGVIIGRALQGAGAIAAVVLALTSDLTRESQRTKAMAVIGMSIGLAFLLALVSAPWLEFFIGVKGLFILTAVLALVAMGLIIKVVPTPEQRRNLEVRAVPAQMLGLLRNKHLIRLDLGIFILHFVLTAMFVVIPIVLLDQLGVETRDQWRVYVPALLASIVFMVPLIILSSRKNMLNPVFMAAISILLFAQCLLMWRPLGVPGITLCLFFFFWGFNLLEALLPSIVSRIAPAASKGSAMGVYNTFQFSGVFLGGLSGGILYGQSLFGNGVVEQERLGITAVFSVCALLLVAWVWLVYSAPKMRLLDSLVVSIDPTTNCQSNLEAIDGVEEVIIIKEESTAYLKVDKARLNLAELEKITNHA